MARIEFVPGVQDDLDRILGHLVTHDVSNASGRLYEIIQAIDVLTLNPLIGRPTDTGLRELVVGRRTRGYVALYRYVEEFDMVLVLALRGQKEAGYQRQ